MRHRHCVCKRCGKEFDTNSRAQKYCSCECANKSKTHSTLSAVAADRAFMRRVYKEREEKARRREAYLRRRDEQAADCAAPVTVGSTFRAGRFLNVVTRGRCG